MARLINETRRSVRVLGPDGRQHVLAPREVLSIPDRFGVRVIKAASGQPVMCRDDGKPCPWLCRPDSSPG